jgi:hypothetical protein
MTATTIEVTCPNCQTVLALPSLGHFTCPKCGQHIGVGQEFTTPLDPLPPMPQPRVQKLTVSNGLGWWTAVQVCAFLFFLLPGIPLLLFAVFCVAMGFADSGGQNAGYGVAAGLMIGIPGFILSLVGYALNRWADSVRNTLICGECRNPTTKHAKICASCKATFR